MAETLTNPWRGIGLPGEHRFPEDDARDVAGLLARCPAHRPTPLLDLPQLGDRFGIARLQAKDERHRMGLGSFKALGAVHAIAREAADHVRGGDWSEALSGRTYVTASAGNHGLSVAAGARVFGARAVVYLARTVPEAFAERLRAKGAEVVRAGATYEDSMAAAAAADQVHEVPTHVVVQAGVGGLAAAVAAWLRAAWGKAPTVVVVEPEAAPALMESIRAERVVTAPGPASAMGRLDWVSYLAAASGPSGYADIIFHGGARVLAQSDILMLDTGAVKDGYFCDFDRNYAIGRVPPEARSGYAALGAATNAALAALRPGMTASELHAVMVSTLWAEGTTPSAGRHGHGLGLGLTEWLSISEIDETPLRAGVVLTLEPSIELVSGRFLVQEENIVLRSNGPELLSRGAPCELPVIG